MYNQNKGLDTMRHLVANLYIKLKFCFFFLQKALAFPKLDGMVFSKLVCSIDGSSLVGLDRNRSTFVHWEFQHNHMTFEQPYEIIRLKESLEIKKIVAAKSHFMFLTETGDVYRWSFGNSSSTLTRMSNSLSTADNVPTIVSTLKGKH